MTKTRSQKLKTVQKTILNKKSAKLSDDFVNRAKSVMVRLDRINLADFDRKRVAYCSIQLDQDDFKPEGESKTKKIKQKHYYYHYFTCYFFLSFIVVENRTNRESF